MPREKPIYTEIEEFNELVAKIIELNTEEFGHIDPKILRMVALQNKEPTYWYKIRPIRNPVAMFCRDVRFIIVVFEQDWEAYNEDQKAATIMNALWSMEPDEEEPKVKSYDLNDHAVMVRTFGVDYLNNPEIKNLLTKPVEWK